METLIKEAVQRVFKKASYQEVKDMLKEGKQGLDELLGLS